MMNLSTVMTICLIHYRNSYYDIIIIFNYVHILIRNRKRIIVKNIFRMKVFTTTLLRTDVRRALERGKI